MRLMGLKFVQDDIWIDGEDESGNYINQCIYNDIEYIDDEMYEFKKLLEKS